MRETAIILFFLFYTKSITAQKLNIPTQNVQGNEVSQSLLVPGQSVFDTKKIKGTRYEMACFSVTNGQKTEVSTFAVEVNTTSKQLAVYTAITLIGAEGKWMDTVIADASTLKPLYRSSFNPNQELVLKYGTDIIGRYRDKKTNNRQVISEKTATPFFDSYLYPYILGSLPLTQGYKAKIPVYDFKTGSNSNFKNVLINDVRGGIYTSEMTGDHKIWQVSVFEEATGEKYEYFIDKETRRTWRIDILSNGQLYMLFNKELDYNPFKTTINKEETIGLITTGTSKITGQAFARDNQSGIKGVAVLNMNKKQYAAPGTNIILIPYTAYFKEWMTLNEKLRKKGRSVPMSKDASECIKVTQVNDEEGHFEFTNLMPGEYMIYTEFEYAHEATYTEVVGYSDLYIDGAFQSTSAITKSHDFTAAAKATIRKIITIKKDGEKVAVKLKKTL